MPPVHISYLGWNASPHVQGQFCLDRDLIDQWVQNQYSFQDTYGMGVEHIKRSDFQRKIKLVQLLSMDWLLSIFSWTGYSALLMILGI